VWIIRRGSAATFFRESENAHLRLLVPEIILKILGAHTCSFGSLASVLHKKAIKVAKQLSSTE